MDEPAPRRRSARMRTGLGLALLAAIAVLVALGTWQVERRAWKRDLIARVEARVHAPAVPAPSAELWPTLAATSDEYRRVTVAGTFLHDRETLVQAVTARGGGFWVMTPLRRPDGTLVLVNRGFVPTERRAPATRPPGPAAAEVTGLLRMSEPGGGFLRRNDPATERWYSRDVAAIASARGLRTIAPYFVDADATPHPGGVPVGGLTVVAFSDNHLVYALTWYALALMAAGGIVVVMREDRVQRARSAG